MNKMAKMWLNYLDTNTLTIPSGAPFTDARSMCSDTQKFPSAEQSVNGSANHHPTRMAKWPYFFRISTPPPPLLLTHTLCSSIAIVQLNTHPADTVLVATFADSVFLSVWTVCSHICARFHAPYSRARSHWKKKNGVDNDSRTRVVVTH